MDKISEEERIKRAEEISARRNNRIPASNINTRINSKRKLSTLSKVFIQVICSMCIFGVFYLVNQNNSYAIEKIKPILAEDTDFESIYNQIDLFIKNISNSLKNKNNEESSDEQKNEENIVNEMQENGENQENNENESSNENNENQGNEQNQDEENKNEENQNNEENDNQENQEQNTNQEGQNEGGVGGGDSAELSETDQDIVFIKANANFIKPVIGYITSGYGEREATEIISANHAGVDIGANTGTEIIASMSGTVELVSSWGDYGNHLKITNGEISTLYAHCSTIIVNQGDYIEQGQKIAEVGSTGRTTGPHLHFEIMRNNKTVDPQKILEL